MANSTRPEIAVLGAGPAGLGGALKLAKTGKAAVTLYEAAPRVGGNAASFIIEGIDCDYGSHRLHPVADESVLGDIQDMLGDDLMLRPRHGRIRLRNTWIHFPLKPLDLGLKLPKPFASALFFDAATAGLRAPKVETETFESVLMAGLGKTMCESFYFPYVRKLWGLTPNDLAPTLAKKRVSGSSLPKLMMKIMRALPGFKSPTTGKFYYPRKGFGQICDRLAEEASKSGADIRLETRIEGLEIEDNKVRAVIARSAEGEVRQEVDAVWSTLPLTTLVRASGDAAPVAVQEAAKAIRFRGMILIYLILETDQFTEFDAHYFPEESIPMSRMSEPKNYSTATEPSGLTILCAELPADPGDEYWTMSDDELGAAMCEWLGNCGLPVTASVRRTETRKLPYAYPVYDRDYQAHFEAMDEWISSIDGLLTYGRQGLFAHDNTHHAMAMAYAAVDCLGEDGVFDTERWADYRVEFESHVVED